MDGKKLKKHLICLILLIFLVNFLANKFYWYFSIWYFDMLMHFLGGLWVGLLSLYLFSQFPQSFRLWSESKALIFKILLFVLFIGVGWEFFEILVNDVIAKNSLNYLDTASDIFFDLSGGLCAILYILVPLKKERAGDQD